MNDDEAKEDAKKVSEKEDIKMNEGIEPKKEIGIKENDKKEHKLKNVKCFYCEKEMDCPESMLNAKKHICFECFNKHEDELSEESPGEVHVDIPKDISEFGKMIDKAIEDGFADFYEQTKSDSKHSTKKEAMEQSFFAGAAFMSALMKHFDSKMMEEEEEGQEDEQENDAS